LALTLSVDKRGDISAGFAEPGESIWRHDQLFRNTMLLDEGYFFRAPRLYLRE